MSIKRFAIGLIVGIILGFIANQFFFWDHFDLLFTLIYSIFALLFAFMCGFIGSRQSVPTKEVTYSGGRAYVINVVIFLVWSLALVILLGVERPPAWMTVIPVGIVFTIFYLIGYTKKKFTPLMKASFVSNYIYLLFVSALTRAVLFPNPNSSGGEIIIFLPIWFFTLMSLIFILIGLFQKPPIQTVASEINR